MECCLSLMSNIMFSADLHKFHVSAFKELISRQVGTQNWPPQDQAAQTLTESIAFFMDALEQKTMTLEECLIAMANCLPTKKEFLQEDLGVDFLPEALDKHFLFVNKTKDLEKSVAQKRFEAIQKDAAKRFSFKKENEHLSTGEKRSVNIAVCVFCASSTSRTANCVASCGHIFICHICLERMTSFAINYCLICGAEISGFTVMKPLVEVW